ncbi:MAG: hypothetical protein ACP5U2_02155 [Bryobacteraceae bacterium]
MPRFERRQAPCLVAAVPITAWVALAIVLALAGAAAATLPVFEGRSAAGAAGGRRNFNPEARELYLRARYSQGLHRPDALLESARLFG